MLTPPPIIPTPVSKLLSSSSLLSDTSLSGDDVTGSNKRLEIKTSSAIEIPSFIDVNRKSIHHVVPISQFHLDSTCHCGLELGRLLKGILKAQGNLIHTEFVLIKNTHKIKTTYFKYYTKTFTERPLISLIFSITSQQICKKNIIRKIQFFCLNKVNINNGTYNNIKPY